MSGMSLQEFADKLNELMPTILREYAKQQANEFYRIKFTMPQLIILEYIYSQDEAKMSDLAHYMNVTTAAMTGMIDRLVRDGYLKRHDDPSDRRIIRVYLTKKGKNTVKDTIEHKRKMTINLFGKISQAERENYLSILMHIRDHLKCA